MSKATSRWQVVDVAVVCGGGSGKGALSPHVFMFQEEGLCHHEFQRKVVCLRHDLCR